MDVEGAPGRAGRTRRLGSVRLAPLLAAGALTAALVGVAALATGCGSLAKDELSGRLLALRKNAPIAAHGLERRRIDVELDGRRHAFDLVHLSVAARDGGTDRLPVVLIHPTPATLCTWVEPVFGVAGAEDGGGFDGLAARRDVHAIELVGHGMAPGNAAPYTFERCARFAAAAIRELAGGRRVLLVGSSYGGEVAWRVALDEPALVAGLVLIDSSGYRRPDGGFLPEEVDLREHPLAYFGWMLNSKDRVRTALEPHFPSALPPERVDEVFLVSENAENWRAMTDLARDENGTRQDEIPRIAAPTLVVWGADDLAYDVDRVGRRFAEEIPDARLVVLDDTGHYPHEERPAEVVRALEAFFDEVDP